MRGVRYGGSAHSYGLSGSPVGRSGSPVGRSGPPVGRSGGFGESGFSGHSSLQSSAEKNEHIISF